MNLEDLGYNDALDKYRAEYDSDGFDLGRIITEHKERYIVKTIKGEYEAEITGNMRFTAENRDDFPVVGDWVTISVFDSDFALIHNILPRYSVITRQAVGHISDIQIIAANVDYAFLVQAADRDFNINRLERYLTICNSSGVKPVIVLTKTDLFDELRIGEIVTAIKQRINNVPVFELSNLTGKGTENIKGFIKKGTTYCMLGSSGVGKSTLLNKLSGRKIMRTDTISHSTNKGKHVTSHRELIVLDSGGIIIDNPGMKEVGIADMTEGLGITFDRIAELSGNCRYSDCTHTGETGCAVIKAVEKGEIDKSSYDNYLKLEKEKNYYTTSVAEKKRKEKLFGKIIKNYKKDVNSGKY